MGLRRLKVLPVRLKFLANAAVQSGPPQCRDALICLLEGIPPSVPAWPSPRRRWITLRLHSSPRLENQVPAYPRIQIKSIDRKSVV